MTKGTPEESIRLAREEAAQARKDAEELRKLRDDPKAAAEQEREDGRTHAAAAAERAALQTFVRTVTGRAKELPYTNAMYDAATIESKAAEFQRLAAAEVWTDEGGNKRVGKAYTFRGCGECRL